MRISDWSSDVCSSDLAALEVEIGLSIVPVAPPAGAHEDRIAASDRDACDARRLLQVGSRDLVARRPGVGADMAGHVEQEAAAEDRWQRLGAMQLETSAGLRLGRVNISMQTARVGEVAEGGQVSPDMNTCDDYLVGR